MKPERWQQASRILESVLERSADQRAAYLDEVCATDVDLRREVESLLAASEQAGSLLDSPAMEMAAPLFLNDSVESILGQSIGHYKIISALGAGGMGDVYLAHDARLDRNIALKLLPTHFTTDRDRLRRFEQEAHVASTLSHTNVCVIHEVGETENGHHYIAMEFVSGATLRQHLSGARLKLTEALDVAIQVASALAAAHAAGIVHRDIKPENIMVRSDGTIKVLDFGLAKLTEQRQTIDSDAATRASVETDAGIVMGTTAYMSPEQARGVPIDARTDIWSLGIVLYEMLAGRSPFEGETASDLIAAILKTEPPPLTYYAVDAPSELEHIACKALQKEREARYQTAGDLQNDLKEIKQELEFQAKLERSVQSDSRDQVRTARGGGQTERGTVQIESVVTDEDLLTRMTSIPKYVINRIKRHKRGAVVSLAILLVLGYPLAYFIYRFAVPHETIAHFQKVKFTRLTTIGTATNPSVSPDGKFIAYVQVENGRYSLWTKAIAGGPPLQIVQSAEGRRIFNTTFSVDGKYVYHSMYEEKDGQDVLYQIPVLGGMQKRILTNLDSHITFSPDGKQLAFVRNSNDSRETQLTVVNADGSDERILATRASEERFSDGGPSWSPDGKIIAIGACLAGSRRECLVVGVAVESREVKELSEQRWYAVGRVEWLRDGTGLVLRADRMEGGRGQFWRLLYPSGEAHRVTDDLNDYGFFSLTADSTALVTVLRQRSSDIWVAPNADSGNARQLTFSNKGDEGNLGVTWTPEGNIVYSSNGGGDNSHLWIVNGDGSNPRQLTDSADDADDSEPAVSPDGRYIVFCSNRSGKHNLWRVGFDGGDPKQLTNDVWMSAAFSPDGRWFACTSGDYGKQTLWRVPVDGGSPMHLTDTNANVPAVSSDGRLIAYIIVDEQPQKKLKVAIIPSEGGAPMKVLEFNSARVGGLQWSPDDSSIIYIDSRQGGANLWRLPLDGSLAKQLTDFKSERIWYYHFTRDGRQLVCARGTNSSDVVMISESK